MIFAIGIFLSAKNKSSCIAQSANESQAILEHVHVWHFLRHFILYVFTEHYEYTV